MLQFLQAFYNINEIATMMGKTVASVQAHLARKNFEAVPPPIHLGRRLAWPVESTNVWIQQRTEEAQGQFLAIQVTSGKIGRPTKLETRSRRLKSEKE